MMQDRARGRRLFMLMRSGGWWVAGLVVSAAVAGALRADEPLAVRIDALMEARRFAEARPLLEQWTDELSRQPGANDPLAEARARHVLGSVLDRLGNPEAAVREFEKALTLYDRGGASPAERGAAWDEAGRAAQGAGRFEQAVRWLEEAAVARSGDPVRAAGSRAQRADALTKLGRLDEAALELREAGRLAGDDAGAQWQVARQRGVLAQTTGRLVEALGYFDQAIGWAGQLGAEAEPLIASLNGQRGQVLFRLGRTAEAASTLQAAADFFQARPESAGEWLAHENNLAAVWLQAGEAGRARDRLRLLLTSPAAATLGDSPMMITPWLNASVVESAGGDPKRSAAALARASQLAEATLPDIHPLRAHLAAVGLASAIASGDTARARVEARRASDQARGWMARLGPTADEWQWLEFRRTMDAVSPLAVVGKDETEALADAVFATQGLGLERLLRGPAKAAAERPGWRAVAGGLPAGAVLVNFVWWRPLRSEGVWSDEGNYGALVVGLGRPPRWIDLGPAAEIELRVRRVIQAASDTVSANQAVRHRASLAFQLRHLWELIWAPVASHVDDADEILLRPDGMMHFVPWAVLREPGVDGAGGTGVGGRWFCQRYPRVRVLAQSTAAAPVAQSAGPSIWRLIAITEAPGTGAPDPPMDPSNDLSADVWREILAMPPLPGARREMDAIRAAAPASVQVIMAAPHEVEAVPPPPARPPEVLHFSGHGFAIDQQDPWGVQQLEAGLIFGDAAAGLRARAAGRPRSGDQDGILSAREAVRLNLNGTQLVMLSACQSALGHWQPGEHLAGLRHAFILAGARHVAAALWDVNDETAPAFIGAFYKRLGQGVAPSEALWHTQREWLELPADDPVVRVALAGAWTVEASGW